MTRLDSYVASVVRTCHDRKLGGKGQGQGLGRKGQGLGSGLDLAQGPGLERGQVRGSSVGVKSKWGLLEGQRQRQLPIDPAASSLSSSSSTSSSSPSSHTATGTATAAAPVQQPAAAPSGTLSQEHKQNYHPAQINSYTRTHTTLRNHIVLVLSSSGAQQIHTPHTLSRKLIFYLSSHSPTHSPIHLHTLTHSLTHRSLPDHTLPCPALLL